MLLVISIFGLLPVIRIEKWKEKQNVTAQLVMFERLYEKSQHSAIIEKESSHILADKHSQKLVFSYTIKGRKTEEIVNIEAPLRINKKSSLELQPGTASPSKLETFSFFDQSSQTKIDYIVQLGSSKVFKYVERQ
ncbi:hypothetical protein [Vagococcus bubulae]|uniref:Competence protein ComGD n=1 Tax=Vagococcus bubulae TaxID=1977868 RepID=A0A429ZAQ8_9ENTE|nr:hypothetical protein [Vagococcus bubulae]RST90788.1 hypothetical protein CBF36_11020 [Vagococcus bubulae]